jgi:sortase A
VIWGVSGGKYITGAQESPHLRPLVQSLANLPVPTVGPQQAARIQIPAIGVDAPVVQGDGWEQFKKGVGQHIGTPNPGENGNIVLSAHNDVFGEIFRDLDQLKDGDKVIFYQPAHLHVYCAPVANCRANSGRSDGPNQRTRGNINIMLPLSS